MSHRGFASYSEPYELEFYILGSHENYIDSAVNVTNKELFKGDVSVPGGCYDTAMGSTSYSVLCSTCLHTKKYCPGHSGSYDTRYPFKSPLFRTTIAKWLKIICHRCGRLVVNKKFKVINDKTLGEYAKLAREVEVCPWADCNEPHPTIKIDKFKPAVFMADYGRGKPKIELHNHIIKDIFERVTNETILTVGKPLKCPPRNLLLDIIRVPPNTVRPDIRKIGGSRSNNSDITALLKAIIETDEVLPTVIPDSIQDELNKLYFNADMSYYEMIKGSSSTNNQVRISTSTNKAVASLATKHPKKEGRIRNNLMGKRCGEMGRSVLSGDNSLAVDEIGIPISMARALHVPITVRFYNKDELTVIFNNRRSIYPGCAAIKKNTGTYHKIEHLDPTYELQEGDIVYRDLIEGKDYCNFNRQPSLSASQIGSHKIKIMEKSSTIRLNVSACVSYGADFDGDNGNLLHSQNIKSRVELRKLSWMGNWMVSPQNYAPYYGCVQDNLIGVSELTRSCVKIDKWHAMLLFSNIKPISEEGFNFDKMEYNGRELVSKFLPKINFPKKKSSVYLPQYAPYIEYNPDEIYVQINRGELISGILDKATIGQETMGSIFHVINNEYGANAALDTIYNLNQIATRFLMWKGYTVGVKDIIIGEDSLKKIHEQTEAMINDAESITKKLFNRELVSPLGVDLLDYYEQEQLNALEPADSFVIPILNDIDFFNNDLAKMVFYGSKGKKQNIININGSLGKITIGGKRPQRNFGWWRTSPYFPRYDMSPRSLGFIENSYREGLDSDIFPFAASDARYGSINNALSTSISGAQNRISIKNLESILTNNLRQATKEENVVQILYAESGVDTRKTELVKFLTASLSDNEMREQYKATKNMFPDFSSKNSNELDKIFDEEFKQLEEDRQTYREIFMRVESNNPGQYLFDDKRQMPVNPYRIIEDVIFTYEDIAKGLSKEQSRLDPVSAVKKVRQLCSDIPYMYFNSNYESKKYAIPKVYEVACTLLCILIRMYLSLVNLSKKKVSNYHLDIIINKIKITFKNSLIEYGRAVGILAAQCLSQVLTQANLDSRHRGGGGGGSSGTTADRFREILAAKSTKDMKDPRMLIMVLPEYEKNKPKVQEIANHIEMMNFERFISSERIFFEPYGAPIHPEYVHEAKIIKQFESLNIGMMIPENLTKWCIRYDIDKESLIINSMKLDTIIIKLRIEFPDIFWVYTPENADNIIIRAYLTHNMVDMSGVFDEHSILKIAGSISKTIIRGVKNITYTEVTHIAKSEIQPDGSIKTNKIFAISTYGTNLEEILMNPYVDKKRTQTNSIAEMEEIFGIDAARNKIITEIIKTMSSDSVIYEHTSIFADEMVFSGSVTGIQKTGLQEREPSNVTLRLSFQSPIQVIEHAALNNITDTISGISGPLVNGQAPSVGTLYNEIFIDEEFVERELKEMNKINDEEL